MLDAVQCDEYDDGDCRGDIFRLYACDNLQTRPRLRETDAPFSLTTTMGRET